MTAKATQNLPNSFPYRNTELPSRRWFGVGILCYKTLEVLFFKLLDWLTLYTPEKSVVGIPSLATKNFTILQAIVYNGKQEEVLGFRPRRWIYRLLRGVPDVEMFERIRFQLAVSDRLVRSVEASTETRGFICSQLPWQLPWHPPQKTFLRIQPQGVQTLLGRIPLGNYEVISAPVFFLHSGIQWIVISDIDDTIKESHISESTSMRKILGGIFKGNYYAYEAIKGMAELYQELAAKGTFFVYLTSTPFQLAPFLLKFLRDNRFPEGPVLTRWLGYGKVRHKWRMLIKILSSLGRHRCFLIGDSGELDFMIYRRISENPMFAKHIEKILIRHVPGTPMAKSLTPTEAFYKEISELRDHFEPILQTTEKRM